MEKLGEYFTELFSPTELPEQISTAFVVRNDATFEVKQTFACRSLSDLAICKV